MPQHPKRGKQRGRNQIRLHVYFEDGSALKSWSDVNLPLPELRGQFVKMLDLLDRAIAAEVKRL